MEAVLEDPGVSELKYECGICLKDFTSAHGLQIHIQTHKDDTYSCDQCGMTFPGFPELDEHLTSFHAGVKVSELASTDNDTKFPVENESNRGNLLSEDGIWGVHQGNRPTEGNNLDINLGKYQNQPDNQSKKGSKFSCKICQLLFESRNNLIRHLKLTNNIFRKEDHLMLDAEANKKLSESNLRNKGGLESLNESSKTTLEKDRPRCRVCKVELPQCKKLRRAHVRKHLLVKPNKRVYHVWKYLKTPRKLVTQTEKPLRISKKPSTVNKETCDITPPASDEDRSGNKYKGDMIVSMDRPRKKNIEGTGRTSKRNPRYILLRCFICGAKFETKNSLEIHFQNVHSERKSLRKLESLPHNKMSSWFTCSSCGKKVHGKENFKNHLTKEHDNSLKHVSIKQKRISDFNAGRSRNLSEGTKHFSKGPWFVCKECGKLCKGKKLLQDHVDKFHRVFDNARKSPIPSKPSSWRRCCGKPSCAWFVCKTCNERFKGKTRINNHILTCSVDTIEENDVNSDLHPQPEKSTDVVNKVPVPVSNLQKCSWYACELCKLKVHGKKRMMHHWEVCQSLRDKSHQKKSPLHRHETLAKRPAEVEVEDCTLTSNPDVFSLQFVKYRCGPWFRCLMCNKLLKGKSNLRNHQHSAGHSGAGKVLVPETSDRNASFTSRYGVKFSVWWCWYTCQVCGLKMRGRENADLHQHADETIKTSRNMNSQGALRMMASPLNPSSPTNAPLIRSDSDITSTKKIGKITRPNFVQNGVWYKCQTCAVAVRGKQAMWSHSHEDSMFEDKGANSASKLQNKWTCSLCAKLFSSKRSLLSHMKTHTECQEYKCGCCYKVFLTKSGFKLHQHIYGKGHYEVAELKPVDRKAGNSFVINDEVLGDCGLKQTLRQDEQKVPKDWTVEEKKLVETVCDLPSLDFYGKSDNIDGTSTEESGKRSKQKKHDHKLSVNSPLANNVDPDVYENKMVNAQSTNHRDSGRNEFRCPTCGLTASSTASLKRHQWNKHTFSPMTANSIKKKVEKYVSSDGLTYRCDICEKLFESKKVAKEHVHNHIVKQYISEHKGSGTTLKNISDSMMEKGGRIWESDDEVMLLDETQKSEKKYSGKHSHLKSGKPKTSEVGCFDGETFFELFEDEGGMELSQNNELKKSSSVVTKERSKKREGEGTFNFDSDPSFDDAEDSSGAAADEEIKISQADVDPSEEKPVNDIHMLVKGEFICQVCFKSFATNMTACEHVLSHFADNSHMKGQLPPAASQLVCDVCGQTFRSTQDWQDHEETHSEEERLRWQNKCQECSLTFKSKQLLTNHLSIHHYVYLKCTQCCSFFVDHAFLNLHILKMKHFCCNCGQVFLNFHTLNEHRNVCDF